MDPVALSQAGPVAILLVGIAAMVAAFVRGDIVPGWIYKKAIEREEKANAQADKNAEALAVLAKAAADAINGGPKRG